MHFLHHEVENHFLSSQIINYSTGLLGTHWIYELLSWSTGEEIPEGMSWKYIISRKGLCPPPQIHVAFFFFFKDKLCILYQHREENIRHWVLKEFLKIRSQTLELGEAPLTWVVPGMDHNIMSQETDQILVTRNHQLPILIKFSWAECDVNAEPGRHFCSSHAFWQKPAVCSDNKAAVGVGVRRSKCDSGITKHPV